MPFLQPVLRLGCLAILLLGCVSSREREPATQPFHERYCRYLAACGPSWLAQFEGGTEAACREAVACSSFGIIFPTKVECPDAVAERCAVLGHVADCDASDLPGDGEPCAGLQCRPGFSCDLEGECPICRPAARIGEPCSSTLCDDPPEAACELGRAFCDRETHTCQALRGAGEPCDGAQQCDGLSCIDGVCAPGHLEGEACAWRHDCASYLICRDGTCAPRARAGEACGSDWPDCQPGLLCVQNVCEKALCAGEPPQVGSPCIGSDCGEAGLFCDPETGRCARTLELGAACQPPEGLLGLARGPCGPNAYCSAEEKRCVTALAEGESCNGAQCAAGLVCMPEVDCDLLCGCDLDEDTRLVCRRPAPSDTCE